MTETTLPPASRYQDGSEKTITIDGVSVTYRVMGGEWVKVSETGIQTIVVPAGQSFRIVDDAENPTMSVLVNNRDATGFAGPDAIGYALICGQLGSETDPLSTIYGYTIPDPESEGYRTAYSSISASDGTGKFAELSVGIEPGGKSTVEVQAEVIKLNCQTYADNAAALAAGLPVGADYNTPAGVRMVVMAGE